MKQYIAICIIVAMLFCAGCSSDTGEVEDSGSNSITVDLNVSQDDSSLKPESGKLDIGSSSNSIETVDEENKSGMDELANLQMQEVISEYEKLVEAEIITAKEITDPIGESFNVPVFKDGIKMIDEEKYIIESEYNGCTYRLQLIEPFEEEEALLVLDSWASEELGILSDSVRYSSSTDTGLSSNGTVMTRMISYMDMQKQQYTASLLILGQLKEQYGAAVKIKACVDIENPASTWAAFIYACDVLGVSPEA